MNVTHRWKISKCILLVLARSMPIVFSVVKKMSAPGVMSREPAPG